MQKLRSWILILIFFLTGCSSPASINSFPTESLAKFTVAPSATELPLSPTPTLTSTPTPAAIPLIYKGFQDQAFSKVCVKVDFKEPEGAGQNENILTAVSDLLTVMGMVVETEGNCEISFELTGSLIGRSANYEDCGRLFTGADFTGKLIMRFPPNDKNLITIPLSGSNEIMDVVAIINPSMCNNPDKEANAPFSYIWQKSVLEGFSTIYGITTLGAALQTSSFYSEAYQIFEEGDFKPEEILPVLQGLLKSEDDYLIQKALTLLNEMNDQAAPATMEIIPVLSHHDKELAAWAVRTLAKIGPGAENAIPALLIAIDDSDHDLSAYAALALGEIGRNQLIILETLINHLSDNDSMSEACQSSLRKLTGQDYWTSEEWQNWWVECRSSQSCGSPITVTPTPRANPVPLTFEDMDMTYSKVCLQSSATIGSIDLSNEIQQISTKLLRELGMEIVQSEHECEIMFGIVLGVNSLTCTTAEITPGGHLDLMLPMVHHVLETVQFRETIESPSSSADCLKPQDIVSILILEGFKEYYGDPVLEAALTIPELNSVTAMIK